MSIFFFCIGGALALAGLTAYDLYIENKNIKKDYEDTFNKKIEDIDKKEE